MTDVDNSKPLTEETKKYWNNEPETTPIEHINLEISLDKEYYQHDTIHEIFKNAYNFINETFTFPKMNELYNLASEKLIIKKSKEIAKIAKLKCILIKVLDFFIWRYIKLYYGKTKKDFK